MKLRKSDRKRLLSFCIVLITLFSISIHAYAHIPCRCNNPPDQCTCFIQLGDKGLAVERIILKLKNKGYLKKSAKKGVFNQEVRQAVIQLQKDHNLECTGWRDDETLDALLYGVLPDESAKHTKSFWDGIYYVPTDGGIRFHSDPACCGMHYPRMISGVNAVSLGLQHCGWDDCKKTSPLTYTALGLTPRDLPDWYYVEEDASTVSQRTLLSDNIESQYIGNKKSHVFHLSTCSAVKKMSEKNKVGLDSREEAIAQEYRPCGICNP